MATRIVRDNRRAILAQADAQVEAIVAKAALDIEALAKTNAPVDTGFLRNSIQAWKVGMGRWRVSVAAFYAIFVELGSTRSRAKPFLLPAFDAVRVVVIAALKRLRF